MIEGVLGIRTSGYKAGLREALAETQRFKQDTESSFSKLGGSLGSAIAGVGIGAMVRQAVAQAGALQDTADALNINVEQLQGLRAAFAQSGTGAEKFDKGLAQLVQKIADARNGNAAAIASFAELGVSVGDLATMSTGDVLLRMADGFRDAGGSGSAFAATMDLLGKNGRTMAAGLSQGGDAIADFASKADKLSAGTVAGLDAIGDNATAVGQKITNGVGKALFGLMAGWDRFIKAAGGTKHMQFGVGDRVAAAIAAATAPKQHDDSTDARKVAAEQAQIEKNSAATMELRAKLQEAELKNKRELMTLGEKLVSLEAQRLALLERAKHAALDESLRLRTEAAKVQGEVNATKKQIEEKQKQADEQKQRADEKKRESDKAIGKAIGDAKDKMEQDTEATVTAVNNVIDARNSAIVGANAAAGGRALDGMIQRQKMTPAERAAHDRGERADDRAEARGERAFARKFGVKELQAVKDARDPAKQIQAEFQTALDKCAISKGISGLHSLLDLRLKFPKPK